MLTLSIRLNALNGGARYSLIDNHPVTGLVGFPQTFPMGGLHQRQLTLGQNLADEILAFVKAGRCFEEDPRITNDDQAKMIWIC